jgi:hypothetical protein
MGVGVMHHDVPQVSSGFPKTVSSEARSAASTSELARLSI